MTEHKLTPAQRRVLELLVKQAGKGQGASLSSRTGIFIEYGEAVARVSERTCKTLEKQGFVQIGVVTAWITKAGREVLGHD